MEDITKRICGRCGQPVDRIKDSYKQVGDQVIHAVCPTSTALNALPTVPAPAGVDDLPVFLTQEEAAKLLRVSTRTIRRKVVSGELPAKRLRGGLTVLIEKKDVLGLLEDAREAP